jgi:xanthine dehydrogenase iron-sulfur cluster and FAD-binding subunit A
MTLYRPQTLDEAVRIRRDEPDAVVVAGGTEVMPFRNRGGRPGPLLDLSRVDELARVTGGRLGATVTYTRVIEELGGRFRVLAAAARTIAGRQVRNRATLGGAMAIADPSGDMATALLACGAEVELASTHGLRRVAAADFFTGPYQCGLRADELIAAVELPPAAAGPGAYAKVGARNAMARAACAVAVTLDPARRSAAIAIGACGPTPLRAPAAEALVAAEAPWDDGGELDPGWLRRVGALVADAARPRSDGRGPEDYKRHAAAVLAGRALRRAWRDRARDPVPSPDAPLRAVAAPASSRLRVDGVDHELAGEAGAESLLHVLREHFALTGPKNACEEGECGSCTVAIDGQIACACLVPASQAAGGNVETVAGLAAEDGSLDPVQEALLEAGGVQCGFCTPGMAMAARDLLRRNPDPSDADIRDGLAGNLCRCTGYEKIVAAVRLAAERTPTG